MPSRPPQILRILRALLGLALAAGVAPLSLPAQEAAPATPPAAQEAAPGQQGETPAQAAPAPASKYTISGAGSFGYRFVDVNGNRGKYDQLFNLQQGFRLFDGQFSIEPKEPNQGWFDRFSMSAQGLGGDPFPILRADLRKNGTYDLRLSYRATQYFYNLPETTLTPNRGWIDRRRFADADLRYTPTRNLRFHFFYNRTERAGSDLATSPFFYLALGPNIWEAFGRANTLSWVVPIREQANLFGGGFDYRVGKTDIHVEQSYRTFNNPANLEGFGGKPITLLAPLQNLTINRWDSLAAMNIPTTSVHLDQEVNGRLQLRAGYIYTRASGPTSLSGSLSPAAGISLNYLGNGSTRLSTQTADVGFLLKLFESVDFESDYRYQIYSERATERLQATRNDLPGPVLLGNDSLRWDFGVHTMDALLSIVPRSYLSVRAGVRFLKEDIVRKTNGVLAPGTQRTMSYAPVVNAAWTPNKKFYLRGDFDSRIIVDPYVRISPEHTVGSTIRTHYAPGDKWGIDNTFTFHNLKTDNIGFLAHTRTNSTTLWYQPKDKLGFQGGFDYGNFSSRNSINFLQGVPPLTGLVSTDQTIDRAFFFGFKAVPKENLTLAFTGQFIRSTGLGVFSRETSTYGPLTWPAWSAEIGYNTKNFGRVVLGWQRSYYHEDFYRAADYSANGFILRFERAFTR